jgi:hypothetical protein
MPYDFRLIDWKPNVQLVTSGSYEQRDFVGAAPILVAANEEYSVLVQTGYAIGLDCIIQAPAPAEPHLLRPKEVRTTRVGSLFWRTEWSYVMAVATNYAPNYATLLATPDEPVITVAPL